MACACWPSLAPAGSQWRQAAAACRTGYDGKKVDVWASGVLLFVMLLGMFPFEVEDENYQNTTGLYGIFMQQVGYAVAWLCCLL
jgi:serine/threonine protein kinase